MAIAVLARCPLVVSKPRLLSLFRLPTAIKVDCLSKGRSEKQYRWLYFPCQDLGSLHSGDTGSLTKVDGRRSKLTSQLTDGWK